MKEITIKENLLKIELTEKLTEINDEDLTELYCFLWAFKELEINNGNEYDKAWIKIKYIKNTSITEYINIFKLARNPSFYDLVEYFLKINEKFDTQNTETKLHLNDYFEQIEDISQNILIIMVFKIESELENILKMKNKMRGFLKIGNHDSDVFKTIRKDKF